MHRAVPIILLTLAGCQTAPPAPGRPDVSTRIAERFQQTVSSKTAPGEFTLPPGASLDDGVTEDEAIAIALWNNAAFHELLADLGLARGDLIQAGLLPNPEFVYFFPMTDKPFKYLFDFPIEAIWLRPIRVKSAEHEADRTAERLTQAGLDLIRDVRQAYADVLLAKERLRVAGESVKIRGLISQLAEKRLKAGDISPQEAATARIDSLQAEQDALRASYDVPVMEERLRNLMGFGSNRPSLNLDPSPPPACQTFDLEALMNEALQSRPDALAAIQAVEAARARVRFAKLGWVRLLGLGDATSGTGSHVFGPALRFTVPLFNRNQGGVTRAEAELERAERNRQTVANQIILDVQRSHLQYRQACTELEWLRSKVRPEVEAAIRRLQAAYLEGNVTIFIVLETTRQLLDNYLREAQLVADLRRFWAELERSTGRKLLGVPAPPTAPVPKVPYSKPVEPPSVPTPVVPASFSPPPAPKPAEPQWRPAGVHP
ncbi:MAG: TolC family protein [Gemmataceae bacterium]